MSRLPTSRSCSFFRASGESPWQIGKCQVDGGVELYETYRAKGSTKFDLRVTSGAQQFCPSEQKAQHVPEKNVALVIKRGVVIKKCVMVIWCSCFVLIWSLSLCCDVIFFIVIVIIMWSFSFFLRLKHGCGLRVVLLLAFWVRAGTLEKFLKGETQSLIMLNAASTHKWDHEMLILYC